MTSYDLGLPNLQVGELIGGGGFARVYRAHDSLLKRDLAIKILRPVMGQDARAAFENEAGLHGPLSRHENIVTIHHAGFTAGGVHPYLVMDLVTGGSLGDQLKLHGTIPWEQAVAWMIPICGAVQHVHDSGILHRDVKPDNILLDPPSTPLLGDLGIACLEDDTRPIEAMSFPHVAPEGLRGQRREAPSDVFSLGTTLYQLLAGRAPFGHTLDERVANLDASPPPLPQDAEAPPWLESILRRALETEPYLRIASAEQFENELRAGLDTHRARLAKATATTVVAPPPELARGSVTPDGSATVLPPPEAEAGGAGDEWADGSDSHRAAWPVEPLYFRPRDERPLRRRRPLVRGLLGIALGVAILAVAIAVIEGVRASPALNPPPDSDTNSDIDESTSTSEVDDSPPSDSFGAPTSPTTTTSPTSDDATATTEQPATTEVPTTAVATTRAPATQAPTTG